MQGRLQKILSAHGVASRRSSEQLILEGRVSVNGRTAVLGEGADDELDDIRVDGAALAGKEEPVYIMLNKPRGVLSAMKDDYGRKTVASLASGAGRRVYPVGRLDMDSEGLLLMTNDGLFANSVMHPSFNITKTYEVCVRSGAGDGEFEALRRPIEIDGRVVQAVTVSVRDSDGAGSIVEIKIHEGRNRQIRKMCAACGLSVVSLKRVAIGALELGGLEPGKWRRLTDGEKSMVTGSI